MIWRSHGSQQPCRASIRANKLRHSVLDFLLNTTEKLVKTVCCPAAVDTDVFEWMDTTIGQKLPNAILKLRFTV